MKNITKRRTLSIPEIISQELFMARRMRGKMRQARPILDRLTLRFRAVDHYEMADQLGRSIGSPVRLLDCPARKEAA